MESGTQESRSVPWDTLSRSTDSKMRLHDIKPHKRINRYIFTYIVTIFATTVKISLSGALAFFDKLGGRAEQKDTAIPP